MWVYNSPIVFLPCIAGLRIKSFKIKGCFVEINGSSQRCWSSSLASADLWVMLSCCLIILSASRNSPCTLFKFLLSTQDLKVNSLIQRLSFSGFAKITSLFVWFGLWKLILRLSRAFSVRKLQFFMVLIWNGTNSYLPDGSFIGHISVDAYLS